MKMAIKGAGGGGSKQARAPVEAPDSLRSVAYARILDLVSEGEIYGFANQTNPLACVFYDETPVANADGSLNFKNVQVDSRTGTQTQDYIKGFPSVENEIGVSVELKVDTPWTRNITNLNLSAVRVRLSVPALSKADTSNGDISGYSVAYVIELATNGGSFVKALDGSFTGKASSKYERSHRIDLPAATTGWTIRVRRLTASANSSAIQDSTFVDSFTEIIDAKLRYPMSALVSTVIDAEQFNNIPSRAYHLKGRIIKVPSNYNPTTRVYTGVWDGTFQSAYSNNPAWVFYDAVTSKRYGLGERVTPDLMDKWALYKIGRYCDQMVPDGRGGTEPRFTANFYAQTQDDAYRVLQNMATMFRGIMYAAGSAITAVADMPEDAVYTYHQGNVGEEGFSYSGSGKRARHTVALVSWNDLTDFGRAKVEYVADDEGIARYGIQPTDVMAIGCTSRGQAMRAGKYILTTERLETDTVTFPVGLDGTVAAPGKIVKIADPKRAGRRIGGRVREATATAITVDAVPVVAPGDTITCILPDTTPQTRTVASIAGNVITVTVAFDQIPVPHSAWVVESAELVAQTFRVLSVTEKDDGAGYSITALKHVAGKFDYVEQNIKIDEPPISALPSRKQAPATGLAITHREFAGEVTSATIVTMSWVAPEEAVGYEVEWRSGDSSWQPMPATGAVTAEVSGIRPGSFDFKVVAVNASGIKSPPAHILGYVVPDQTAAPTVVADLQDGVTAHTAELIAQQAAIDAEEAARLAADLAAVATAAADATAKANAARDAAIAHADVIGAQVADIIGADVWVTGKAYPSGDLVRYGTGLYRALRDNTSKQPDTNPLDWQYLGQYNSLGEAVAGSISMGHANASDIAAEAAQLDAVQARMSGTSGALATSAMVADEALARATADTALGTRTTALEATVNDGTTGLANTRARLITEETTRANADTALGNRTTTIEGRMSGTSGALATQAQVSTAEAASVSRDNALGSRIDTTDAAVAGKASSGTVSALQSQVTDIDGRTTANATALTGVKAQLGGGGNLLRNTQFYSGADTVVTHQNPGGQSLDRGLDLAPGFTLSGEHTLCIHEFGIGSGATYPFSDHRFLDDIPCVPGQRVEASIYLNNHRCESTVQLAFVNEAGADLAFTTDTPLGWTGGAGTTLATYWRRGVIGTAPAGTARARLIVKKYNTLATYGDSWVFAVRPQLAYATADQTAISAWSPGNDGKSFSAVTQTMQAEVDSVGNIARAAHSVVLDVGGNISGTRSENDGTTSMFSVLATIFRVISSGSTGLEWRDGYLRAYSGAIQLILGINFGESSNLCFWYGPNVGAAGCTKANGTIWFDNVGAAYFGGSLSAGAYKNAVQTTSTAADAEIINGPFATNGNPKNVVVSYNFVKLDTANTGTWGAPTGSTTATIAIYRKVGGGAESLVTTFNVTGTVERQNETGGPSTLSSSMSGSHTFTDNTAGTGDFTYRAIITARSNHTATQSSGTVSVRTTQTLGIISTE